MPPTLARDEEASIVRGNPPSERPSFVTEIRNLVHGPTILNRRCLWHFRSGLRDYQAKGNQMAEDQCVRKGLLRAISRGVAVRDFEGLKETYPVLAGWSSPTELAQHLASPGRVFARKILLDVLVRAAQLGAPASRLAIDILWLVFSPALLELAAHYCRRDRQELPEVLAVVYERFASAVRNVRAAAGSALFGEVLERTTIDVRAHLEHDRSPPDSRGLLRSTPTR